MDRRNLLHSAALASLAPALPASAALASAPYIDSIIGAMVDAFVAETRCYRTAARPHAGPEADDGCDGATSAAYAASLQLLDQPMAEAMGSPDYLPALALIHRRWLIMEGSYSDEADRNECLLVDVALAGHRFDAVPLLWHIDGSPRTCRPPEDELQTRWEKAR